eukprot:scaffold20426_cov47-Attheya_sp.AAC.16
MAPGSLLRSRPLGSLLVSATARQPWRVSSSPRGAIPVRVCIDRLGLRSAPGLHRQFSSAPVGRQEAERQLERDDHVKNRKKAVEPTVESFPSTIAPGAQDSPEKRRRLSEVKISEVLKAKHTRRWVQPVIPRSATVRDAIITCIEGGLSGMMVVDRDETTTESSRERGKVVGMATSRDLLRMMSQGFKDGKTADQVLGKQVGDLMTPISQVIYTRPDETIGMCRTIMAKLGIKCLPVLYNGRVEGLVTARDMSDFGLEAKDRGGKKNYLNDISERVGLSANTSMADPPLYLRAHLADEQAPLFINVGVAEMPHPFKTHDGVGMNLRGVCLEEISAMHVVSNCII